MSTENMLRGNREVSLEIRNIMGIDKTNMRAVACKSYSELCIMTFNELSKLLDTVTYEPAIDFITMMCELCKREFLPTHAEFGYFERESDFSFPYVGVLLPTDSIKTIQLGCTDEDIEVYICDAASELAMWKKERDNPLVNYGGDARKPKIISRYDPESYANIMFLRYPTGDFEPLGNTAIIDITAKYVWVQFRPRVFGEKNMHTAAFIRGIVNTIAQK